MDYRDSRRKPVKLGEAIGRGGEATIYKVANQPGMLAKVYEHIPRSEYARKLVWMRDHPPNDPTAAQQHASLAWPADLLFSSKGQLSGYLMPYIEKAVSLLDVFNPRQCARILPEFNRRYLHRAARNLAAALGALHVRGYVVGDLNESNILVTPRALVTLIDTDSFQVREPGPSGGIVHTCPVARLEYTPPELQGKSLQNTERSPEQDAFGLAVLIYQLLMNGNHPFRAQWLGNNEPPPLEERIRQGCFPFRSPPICPVLPPPNTPSLDVLHPEVASLVLRCFVDGHRNPHRRPNPDQWERALGKAENSLITCRNGHYYSNHLSDCPVCNPPSPGRQIPLPPLNLQQFPSHPLAGNPAASGSSPQTGAGAATRSAGRNPSGAHAGTTYPSTSPRYFFNRILSRLGLTWAASGTIQRTYRRFSRRHSRFTRQTLLESLGMGSLLGSAAGSLGGGLAAILMWGLGQGPSWGALLAAGAVLAAAWRSLQIGLGVGYSVLRTIGWELVLKAILILALAGAGMFIGWVIAPLWQAVGIGGLMGGFGGWLIGDAIWNYNPRLRWDLVGAGTVILLFAWLAYLGGTWLGGSWLGQVSAKGIAALATWADGQQVSRIWISAGAGALGGGIGGALAGGITESLAEMLGFRK